MVFRGSGNIESIFFHPAGNSEEVHWIDLTMIPDAPTFMVTCCCDENWKYEFVYTKSDYERIKYNVMTAVFESETVDEVMEMLDEVFQDSFADILIDDDKCACNCGHCDECGNESKYMN